MVSIRLYGLRTTQSKIPDLTSGLGLQCSKFHKHVALKFSDQNATVASMIFLKLVCLEEYLRYPAFQTFKSTSRFAANWLFWPCRIPWQSRLFCFWCLRPTYLLPYGLFQSSYASYQSSQTGCATTPLSAGFSPPRMYVSLESCL